MQNSKKEGLSLLYDKYAGALYGVIFKVVQQQEAAEEVLQDTILKIWNNASKFDASKGTLPAWIVNIARNAAIDRIRLKKINTKTQELEPISNTLEQQALNPDVIGVKELTEKLNPEQKAIIDLIYFNGYTQSETAEALNIPVGTVKTRLRAAILKMREMFSLE
ncbi:MAG: sigma-70 family RNA polymerase sigma factor [Saprospiraceae bacterium]|nr:sigma-70 family RNA polymerase sigma factor [Saprospiraceae bacterium]